MLNKMLALWIVLIYLAFVVIVLLICTRWKALTRRDDEHEFWEAQVRSRDMRDIPNRRHRC